MRRRIPMTPGGLAAAALAFGLLVAAPAVAPVPVAPVSVAWAKGKKGESPAVAEFTAAYSSDDPVARSAAIEKLRNAPDDVKVALLKKHVVPREKRADVMSRAITILSRLKEGPAIAEISKLAGKGKTAQRLVYLESLAAYRTNADAHAALLTSVTDRKSPHIRGMAAYGLGEHRLMDALDPLMKCLDDSAWQVQASALAALPALRDKAAVKARAPEILEYMESVSGRMRTDAGRTLKRLLGKDHGRDVEKWRLLIEGREEEIPKEKAGPSGGYGNSGKPHFYGIEVDSNKVVILLDVSLSMNDAMEIDKDRLRRETSRRRAVTGDGGKSNGDRGEDGQYDIPWWRIKSRLDLAKYQTINLVSQLEPEQHFEIILFSTDVRPWMGRLVPANEANKTKAYALLEAIVPEDKTNTWGAIAAAYDLMDNEAKSYKSGPDEIYMVTDGAPSVGDIVEQDQILDAAIQLWKVNRIRFNCIGIGVDLRFLRKLCRRTGGTPKMFK